MSGQVYSENPSRVELLADLEDILNMCANYCIIEKIDFFTKLQLSKHEIHSKNFGAPSNGKISRSVMGKDDLPVSDQLLVQRGPKFWSETGKICPFWTKKLVKQVNCIFPIYTSPFSHRRSKIFFVSVITENFSNHNSIRLDFFE